MKLGKITINRFRHLNKIDIFFGKNITAIAGQNATGKSSILGLVGHLFNYRGMERAINGEKFVTDYSEIFRFSYPDFDKPKMHDYVANFDSGEPIKVLSYDRMSRGNKKGLRLRVGKSAIGHGKIDLPVLYLGLRRLFPLAQENKIKNAISDLTEQEKIRYQNLHNDILIIREQIEPKSIETSKEKISCPHNKKL